MLRSGLPHGSGSSSSSSSKSQQALRYAVWSFIGGILLTLFLIYFTYSHLMSTSNAKVSVNEKKSHVNDVADGARKVGPTRAKTTWNMGRSFVDVPHEVLAAASGGSVKVVEKNMKLTVGDGDKTAKVNYREAGEASLKAVDVVLLHGMRFSSKTWEALGTLQLVAAMGHHAVAVDLPGYGNSSRKNVKDEADFLHQLIDKLKLGKPVLISPSMSGNYALPFLLARNAAACKERVRGFIPIEPAGVSRFSATDYRQCKVATMIVYGEKGKEVRNKKLRFLENSAAFKISGAGHSCYMDNPKEWHRLLYNFLLAIVGNSR